MAGGRDANRDERGDDRQRRDPERSGPGRTDSERRERLDRAEARRRERRARAAAAERERADGKSDGDVTAESSGRPHLSMLLRAAALALLAVGFVGLSVSEAWLSPAESPYAVVFGAGVVCAIASVYLAIYRHDAGE